VDEILKAVATLQAGEVTKAREQLLDLWERWRETDRALERCTIAHFLADTERMPRDELQWDLVALEAASGSKDRSNSGQLEGFLPSLHLNAGDAYRRLGDLERARSHAEMGLAHAGSLKDDPYANMTRTGLERLMLRLDADTGFERARTSG
jgi:hypothetical protein